MYIKLIAHNVHIEFPLSSEAGARDFYVCFQNDSQTHPYSYSVSTWAVFGG